MVTKLTISMQIITSTNSARVLLLLPFAFSALTLLVGRQEAHLAFKKFE